MDDVCGGDDDGAGGGGDGRSHLDDCYIVVVGDTWLVFVVLGHFDVKTPVLTLVSRPGHPPPPTHTSSL